MPMCKQCGWIGPGLIDGLCAECKLQNEIDLENINNLIEEGHPYHCACRQVWGDGECECGLVSYGYDPYRWMTLNKE